MSGANYRRAVHHSDSRSAAYDPQLAMVFAALAQAEESERLVSRIETLIDLMEKREAGEDDSL